MTHEPESSARRSLRRKVRGLAALLLLACIPLLAQEDPKTLAARAEMKRLPSPPPQGNTLVVAVRLKKAGEASVESVTELAGVAPVAGPLNDFFWTVTEGEQLLAAQSFPNPFEGHSYGGRPKEHAFIPLDEATVVVAIPGRSLDGPLERLEVRFYRIKPGDSSVEALDAPHIDSLRQANRLETLATLSGASLAAEARKKGVRKEGP